MFTIISFVLRASAPPASSFTTTWAKTIKMEEKQVDQQQPKHNHETTLRYYGMRVSEFSVCVSPSSNMQPQLYLLLLLHVRNYPDHHQKESRCPSNTHWRYSDLVAEDHDDGTFYVKDKKAIFQVGGCWV